MRAHLQLTTAASAGLLVTGTAYGQHPATPAGITHEEHMAQMKKDAELKQHRNLTMASTRPRRSITSR
jgi:hypothetical protein